MRFIRLYWPVIVFAILLLIVWTAPSWAQIATDGDSLNINGERIRIVGLDAPEKSKPLCQGPGDPYRERRWATFAQEVLAELIRDPSLSIERTGGLDRWGRTLARVYVRGHDVAEVMVRHGLALPYTCPRGRCPRRQDWCLVLRGLRFGEGG